MMNNNEIITKTIDNVPESINEENIFTKSEENIRQKLKKCSIEDLSSKRHKKNKKIITTVDVSDFKNIKKIEKQENKKKKYKQNKNVTHAELLDHTTFDVYEKYEGRVFAASPVKKLQPHIQTSPKNREQLKLKQDTLQVIYEKSKKEEIPKILPLYARDFKQSNKFLEKQRTANKAYRESIVSMNRQKKYHLDAEPQFGLPSVKINLSEDATLKADQFMELIQSGIKSIQGSKDSVSSLLETFENKLTGLEANAKMTKDEIVNLFEEMKDNIKKTKDSMSNNVLDWSFYAMLLGFGVNAYYLYHHPTLGAKLSLVAISVGLIITGKSFATRMVPILEKAIINLLNDANKDETGIRAQASLGGIDDYSTIFNSLLGAWAVYMSPTSKMPEKLFDKLSHFDKAKVNMSSIVTTILSKIEVVYNSIMSMFGQEDFRHFVETKDFTIDKIVSQVKELQRNMCKGSLALTPENFNLSLNLDNDIKELLRKMPRDGRSAGTVEHLKKIETVSNSIQKYFLENDFKKSGYRTEPVGVLIKGPPGIGKSNALHAISAALVGSLKSKKEIDEFRENTNTQVYNRTAEAVYWDGYKGQLVTFFDDIGQLVDVAGNPDNEWMNCIRAINSFEYPLHMANMNQKGNTYFSSEFVLASTNLLKFSPNSIISEEALMRRFCVTVAATPKEKYATNKNDPITVRRLDYGKIPKRDGKTYLHPEFLDYHLQKRNRKGEFETIQILEFSELLDLILSEHSIRNVWKDTNEDVFSEYLDKYANMRIEPQSNFQEEVDMEEMSNSSNDEGTTTPESLTHTPLPDDVAMYEDSTGNINIILLEMDFRERMRNFINIEWVGTEHQTTFYDYFLQEINRYELMDDDPIKKTHWMLTHFSELFDNTMLFQEGGTYDEWRESVHLDRILAYLALESVGPWEKKWRQIVLGFNHWRQDYIVEPLIKLRYFLNLLSRESLFYTVLLTIGIKIVVDFVMNKVVPQIWNFIKGIISYMFPDVKIKNYEEYAESQSPIRETPGKKGGRKAVRLIRAQDGNNEFLNHADSVMRRNMFSFHLIKVETGKTQMLGHILFVKGNVALIPYHFLQLISHKVFSESGEKQGKWKVKIDMSSDVTIDALDLLSGVGNEYGKLVDRDLCLVQMPTHVQRCRTIVEKFFDNNTFKKLNESIPVQLVRKMDDHYYFDGSQANVVENVPVKSDDLEDYDVSTAWTYRIATRNGDCGSLLYSVKQNKGPQQILGMHVAGNKDVAMGFASIVTQEILNEELEFFDLNGDSLNPVTFDPEKLTNVVSQSGYNPEYDLSCLGEVTPVPKSPTKSQWKKSVLWKPSCKTDTAMLVRTENIDPWKAVDNYIKPKINNSDEKLLKMAVDQYVSKITKNFVGYRVFSFEEAIEGLELEKDFNSIDRSTSAGYPYNCTPGISQFKKKYFFGDGEKFDFSNPNATKLREEVYDCIRRMQEGRYLIPWMFTDTLKDERRPIEKVKEGKTRLFSGGPIVLLIINRMYMGSLMVHTVKERILNGMATGMNPYSNEWGTLKEYLEEVNKDTISKDKLGTLMGAGDFSKFDSSEMPIIFAMIFDAIEQYIPSLDKHVMLNLKMSLICSLHVLKGKLYCWYGGMPSGHPLTTFVNNIVNQVGFRYCWLRLVGTDEKDNFEKHVRLVVQGDDNIFCVRRKYHDKFNELLLGDKFREINLTFTSDTKGEFIDKYRPLRDLQFLKRKWRFERDISQWVSPLSIDTLEDMPMWTRDDDPFTMHQVIDTVRREYAYHGKEVFLKKFIPLYEEYKLYFGQYDLPSITLDWERSLEEVSKFEGFY